MALSPREEISRAFEMVATDPKAALASLLEIHARTSLQSEDAWFALRVLQIAAAAAGDAATELMAASACAEHAPTAVNLLSLSHVLHRQKLWARAIHAYQQALDAVPSDETAWSEPIIRADLELCEQKLPPKLAEVGPPLTREDMCLYVAEWLIDQGRADEARVALADGLAQRPSSERIRQALTDLKQRKV